MPAAIGVLDHGNVRQWEEAIWIYSNLFYDEIRRVTKRQIAKAKTNHAIGIFQ